MRRMAALVIIVAVLAFCLVLLLSGCASVPASPESYRHGGWAKPHWVIPDMYDLWTS